MLGNAANRTEYRLLEERMKFNLSTDDGKLRFLMAATQILAECGSIECDIYATRLSNELGVNVDSINAQIKSAKAKLRKNEEERRRRERDEVLTRSFEDKNNPERAANLRAARAEETIIASFMRNPDFYKKLKDKLAPEDFVTAFNRRLYECLIQTFESGVDAELSQFAGHFSPEEMDSVTRIFISSNSLSNTLKECEDCISVLKEKAGPKITDASGMSDEEFLKLFKK